MRRPFASILTLALQSGCSPLRVLNATIPSGGVRVTEGLRYGEESGRTLDVYQPPEDAIADGLADGRRDRPLVVFFYGGSWKHGDKAEYSFVGTALARRGMVVVIPNYRLYPQTVFPGFLQDAASATSWAGAHAAEFGASPSPFLIGHSAGAYNAVMLAVNPAYLTQAGFAPGRIAGTVGIAGPYDFHPKDFPDIAPIFAAAPEAQTQPIAFADGTSAPMLLLAAADDDTVLPCNTRALGARIAAHGGRVEERVYPGLGHIGILLAFAPLFAGKAPIIADVTRFIAAVSGNPFEPSGMARAR